MKFIVEVEDFYLEDEELSVSLKQLVKNDVASQIREGIKTKVQELTEKVYKEETQKGLEKKIALIIGEITSSHKIKTSYYDKGGSYKNEDVSIEQYIELIFSQTNMKSKTDELIQSITTKHSNAFVVEMKQRYDMMFASQLVNKMNEVGMLKDNVANILLNKGE